MPSLDSSGILSVTARVLPEPQPPRIPIEILGTPAPAVPRVVRGGGGDDGAGGGEGGGGGGRGFGGGVDSGGRGGGLNPRSGEGSVELLVGEEAGGRGATK